MDKLTSRSIILDSVQAQGLGPEYFPITRKAMEGVVGAKYGRFADSLAALKDAIERGTIIKSRLADLRGGLSRVLEVASEAYVSRPFYHAGEFQNRPAAIAELNYAMGGLQSVAKVLKMVKPLVGKDPAADAAFALYSEWERVVDALESLKAKTTTTTAIREEKKAVEAKAKAAIPPSRLSAVVEAAVNAMKPQLAVSYAEFVERALAELVQKFGPKLDNIANSGSYKFFDRTIRPVLDRQTMTISNAAMKRAADAYASAVADGWKDKIMSKAGELDNPEVKRLDGNTFRITGTRFGKEVVIVQDMIVNVSKLGTMFNQWPAKIYVSGKFVSEAAYKGMKQ